MYIILALIVAYLVGSIPTGYIFGKLLKGIDIRKHGSGNVGATNVFRVVGKTPGVIVLILDFLKGLVAVTLIPMALEKVFPQSVENASIITILLGSAAIAGHLWTCFLKFKGGKGVATTGGVMAGLAPGILLACFGVWIIVFVLSKYVSLASMTAALALPVFALISGREVGFIVFCGVLCMVGIYSHRENIKRLIQGTEKKIVK